MKVPVTAPTVGELLRAGALDPDDAQRWADVRADDRGRYRHWDTQRHVRPPDGLSAESWWLGTKLARASLTRAFPLRDRSGRPFSCAMTDSAYEMVHRIDQQASGQIGSGALVTDRGSQRRYVVSSLIEEAITSSQLEGASTTARVAREMLRTERPPQTAGERMILGNFHGMEFARRHREDALTPELVLALHRVIGAGTVRPGDLGQLQRPDDERVAVIWSDQKVLHRPPPAEELPDRLAAMCEFANGWQGEGFLHPVVRAILLHLWLAYDHPFADGNGRTARALFYWSMLHQGYWLAEYLSVSRILLARPAKYARSFLYVETDENDATYFVLAQLRVICRAIEELRRFLDRKVHEVRDVERLLGRAEGFNRRQLALLGHALRHPDWRYTYQSHANSHGVVYQSGRTDLLDLERRGLLTRRVVGRAHEFMPAADLSARLEELAATA